MKKRCLSMVLALIMLCSLITPCFAAQRTLRLTAHRGYSSIAPENTLAAVKEAGKQGFYGCEFDIQTTKDKVWVAIHNSTINAVTNGVGSVSSMTYDQLQKYTITKANGLEKYPDEKIPTLTQMLDECKKWGLHPVIEIKGNDSASIPALCALLDSRAEKSRFTVISFNKTLLSQVKSLLPNMECSYLTEVLSALDVVYCKKDGIEGISFDGAIVDKTVIQSVANQGVTLSAWTIDNVDKAKALYEAGVDNITTNKLTPDDTDEITSAEKTVFSSISNFFRKITRTIKSLIIERFS